MRHAQNAFIDIYNNLGDNIPSSITWETNGTQKLSDDYKNLIQSDSFKPEAFFSVSPKLWTVAGEKREKAIKPEIVKEYYDLSKAGQLKFVVGQTKEEWQDLDEVVTMFRDAGVHYPIWIMPVGAREEEQSATAGDVAKMAFERGYNVAGRMHVYLFGNAIGT